MGPLEMKAPQRRIARRDASAFAPCRARSHRVRANRKRGSLFRLPRIWKHRRRRRSHAGYVGMALGRGLPSRRALYLSQLSATSRVCRGRVADLGSWHRSDHRDVQPGQRRAAQASPLSTAEPLGCRKRLQRRLERENLRRTESRLSRFPGLPARQPCARHGGSAIQRRYLERARRSSVCGLLRDLPGIIFRSAHSPCARPRFLARRRQDWR